MGKRKEIALNFACKYILTPKHNTDKLTDLRRIDCEKKDVKVILNTSNNIMQLQIDDKCLYFRQCKRHTEIHQYVASQIEYYYTRLHPELSEDRVFIENALRDKKNFKKFISMGIKNDNSSGAHHFLAGHGAGSVGLDGMPAAMEKRVRDFVQFIWGELFAYRLNGGLKTGEYQTYNALRGIATYRVAKLLGLDALIPKTEYAMLCIDGETVLFGSVMEEAPGVSVEKMDAVARRDICTPELQRALNNLNVLDVICHEKDHRPGNYLVTVDRGKATGVSAFDNDSPNSFGIGGISFETYVGCSPWALKGRVNRPYVDADLAERITKVSDKDLKDAIGDLLNKYQVITMKSRFHKVRNLLTNMPKDRLIPKELWSEDTIQEELSGAYGKTYLTKFLEK